MQLELGSISAALSCLVYVPPQEGLQGMGSFPEQRPVIEPKLEPTNFEFSVILNTQNGFTWIPLSIIYYQLFKTPAISNKVSSPLWVSNARVQLYLLLFCVSSLEEVERYRWLAEVSGFNWNKIIILSWLRSEQRKLYNLKSDYHLNLIAFSKKQINPKLVLTLNDERCLWYCIILMSPDSFRFKRSTIPQECPNKGNARI